MLERVGFQLLKNGAAFSAAAAALEFALARSWIGGSGEDGKEAATKEEP